MQAQHRCRVQVLPHAQLHPAWETGQGQRGWALLAACSTGEALSAACRHLKSRGRLTEDAAMFYAAVVLLALEYLHKQSIIYRDLKVG